MGFRKSPGDVLVARRRPHVSMWYPLPPFLVFIDFVYHIRGGDSIVIIEVDDDVWEAISRDWALLGIRGHENVVRFLVQGLWEEVNDMLDDAES